MARTWHYGEQEVTLWGKGGGTTASPAPHTITSAAKVVVSLCYFNHRRGFVQLGAGHATQTQ